jgi:hypothetical protein
MSSKQFFIIFVHNHIILKYIRFLIINTQLTMKRIIIFVLFLSLFYTANAQKYITKTGFIGFYGHTPMEDIRADNNQVASVLDISSGELVFQVLIKSFHFDRALMEEHFNENYMSSENFPKASFKGKITNLSTVDFKKNGVYEVTVEGDITIRDATNKVTTKGTIEVVAGGINANSIFNIVPEDYKINIPGVVREKIAKSIEVTVKIKYLPLATN